MKILKKIWSILKELNKLIFGFDLEEYSQNNETEENNASQSANNENIAPEETKPEIGILEPFQGIKIIKKPIDDYIQTSTKKRIIVLHYTAGGTLSGAEAQLSLKDYVNVHYGLDDDGTVYRYIDEKYYCYHTGTGKQLDSQAIGIEIRNWGHLDNKMKTWTGKQLPPERVIKLNTFRGYQYWEKLTPQQIFILPLLINDFKSRWGYDMIVITHAQVKATKLDFPPDYPLIKDLITIKDYPVSLGRLL